jgi:hypothetical protein
VPFQMVHIDLFVPPAARGRAFEAAVTLRIGATAIEIPLAVTVLDATLPQTTSFVVELNSYSKFHRYYKGTAGPDREWEIQLDYHRLCHSHRCNFNVLPYTQMGAILCDAAPHLGRDGSITDWRAWDARYLPILDGTAFTGGLRAGVPVTYFYLPIHENWPGSMAADYRYNIDTGATRESYLAALCEHDTVALPIEHAFAPEYGEKLFRAAADFARHLAAAGLDKPLFINYFNNKHIYRDPGRVEGVNQRTADHDATSWWLLDEPNQWSDYLALRWFGDIVRKGYQRGGTRVQWCLDISRPQWDRDILRGQRDLVRVSSALYQYPRLMKQWQREGTVILNYGQPDWPFVRPLRTTAWAWHAWSHGADGILPWSATPMEGFSEGDWLRKPDRLAVVCPVHEDKSWSRPTLRLKCFRRGQQDMEMCNMLVATGMGRARLAAEVRSHLGRLATLPETFADEASSYASAALTPARLEGLRRAIRVMVADVAAG